MSQNSEYDKLAIEQITIAVFVQIVSRFYMLPSSRIVSVSLSELDFYTSDILIIINITTIIAINIVYYKCDMYHH